MTNFNQMEIWFVTGSQHLYGPKTLAQVDVDSSTIVDGLNKSGKMAPISKKSTNFPVLNYESQINSIT